MIGGKKINRLFIGKQESRKKQLFNYKIIDL